MRIKTVKSKRDIFIEKDKRFGYLYRLSDKHNSRMGSVSVLGVGGGMIKLVIKIREKEIVRGDWFYVEHEKISGRDKSEPIARLLSKMSDIEFLPKRYPHKFYMEAPNG